MPEQYPFTVNELLEYPDFIALPPELRDFSLSLVENERLNIHGNLKRSLNSFVIYRCLRSPQIPEEYKTTHGRNIPGHLLQKHILQTTQTEWLQFTSEEKKVYKLRANLADEQLRQAFRYYKLCRIAKERWHALNRAGKQRFFFETMRRICMVLVYNAHWPGYLNIKDSLKTLSNGGDQPVATPRHAARGSGNKSPQQHAPSRPRRKASHPYDAAHRPKRPKQPTVSEVNQPTEGLIHPGLGPQVLDRPEQTFELLTPQPQEALVSVYTDAGLSVGAPQDVLNQITMTECSIPDNAWMNWDATANQNSAFASGEELRLAPHAPMNTSIPQEASLAYLPPTGPLASSTSGAASSQSSIAFVQAEHPNHGYGVHYSAELSENWRAQGERIFTSPSTFVGLTQPPSGLMSNMSFAPLTACNAEFNSEYSYNNTLSTASNTIQSSNSYYMGNLGENDIDLQYYWPSTRSPAQNNFDIPDLHSGPLLNPNNHWQEPVNEGPNWIPQGWEYSLRFDGGSNM